MLFNNYNLNNIPVIKGICKDILEGFVAQRDHFNMREESNLLTDYIREYLIENHLICIKYEGDGEGDVINKYKQLYESFNDERTAEFIKLYFGNNAINTTELSNILPIYL